MKYRVQCVRYGYTEVEAEGLPMSRYTWSGADNHQVVGGIGD